MKLLSVLFALMFAAVACSKSDDESKKTPEEPAAEEPAAEEPAADEPAADDGPSPLAAVMSAYETCRSLLANDKGEGVDVCAVAMAQAAGQTADVPDAAKPLLAEVVAKAEALSKVAADDLAALRLAFGDVSKPVVELIATVPEAAAEYHVFECPMAEGYKRWAQPNAELENPYMGQEMLSCGAEVHDHHEGMKPAKGMMKH